MLFPKTNLSWLSIPDCWYCTIIDGRISRFVSTVTLLICRFLGGCRSNLPCFNGDLA